MLGIVLFGESASPLRLFFVTLLLVSIVGLKLTHLTEGKDPVPPRVPLSEELSEELS